MMGSIRKNGENRVSHNSQYILSLQEKPNKGEYAALFEPLKANGYSSIRFLQIWIRGEILYYVMADGLVLRPAAFNI
jgi:hypothetical protein